MKKKITSTLLPQAQKTKSTDQKSVSRNQEFSLGFFLVVKSAAVSSRMGIATTLIFFLLISPLLAQHSVTTHAGSSQGFMDATGTSAKFKAPTGICISPDGAYLYVADYSGHRIRRIDAVTKSVTTIAGNGSSGYANGTGTAALFSYPSGICISPDGAVLYVCDYGNSYIRKIILATLTVSTIAGDGSFNYADNTNGLLASFNGATDVKISGDSILYISDTDNHLLRKLNLNTSEVSTLAGMVGVGGFQNGVGTNAAFRLPKGLAVSTDGATLYVADNGNNMIRAVDLTTKNATTIAGDGTPGYVNNMSGTLAQFNAPNGVAVVPGDADVLYVADNGNHRIREISISTTSVITIAGTGAVPPAATYGDNANGMSAKFFYPTNLIVSPDSKDIYVADQGNFRVRKVKTDMNVTGIFESPEMRCEVFPNPGSEQLNISVATLKNKLLKIELYDALGGLVLTDEKTAAGKEELMTENISGLPGGMYFLKIKQSNGFATRKIAIVR